MLTQSSVASKDTEPQIFVRSVPVRFSRLILSSSVIRTTRMPDIIFYLFVFALGFAAGYGVREYMSRKRHRRAREQAGY